MNLEEANRTIREAVAARMAATPADDPKMRGYLEVKPLGVKTTIPNAILKPLPRRPLVGLAGHIGSGKTAAAAMVPDAVCIQWADSLYSGLAAMLGVDELVLRDRTQKELPLTLPGGIKVTPRRLLETLGTDWGRDTVHPDLWVSLTMRRVDAAKPSQRPIAICGTRFPNEVAAIRERGGEVWWIERPGVGVGTVHTSGSRIGPADCDAIISNDGTLDDLRTRIAAAWSDYTR